MRETNARAPGYLQSVAVMLTHGVGYYALQILLCIGSVENIRIFALCKPFLNGPQFHLCILIIPQTRAGIMKTEDARADLLSRNPELRKHVPGYDTYLKTRCCPRRAICAVTFVGSELLTNFKDQSIGLSSSGAIHPGKFCVRAPSNWRLNLETVDREDN